MGGFEGGDEGGFWDEDTLLESINANKAKKGEKKKLSIDKNGLVYSIKATAKEGELYDTISFIPYECSSFTLEGCDEVSLESNTIYKAYQVLCEYTDDSEIVEFFTEHKVVVTKSIPISSGLKGASSDAAAFIYLVKEMCSLVLTPDELENIAQRVGRDTVSFMKR